MGLFSRRVASSSPDLPPRPDHRKQSSFTDPPNVFYPAPQQPLQPPYPYSQTAPRSRPAQWLDPPNVTQPALLTTQGIGSSHQALQLAPTKQDRWRNAQFPVHQPRPAQLEAYHAIEQDFDDVMTLIDSATLHGDEDHLFTCGSGRARSKQSRDRTDRHDREDTKSADDATERALYKLPRRGKGGGKQDADREGRKHKSKPKPKPTKETQSTGVAASVVAGTYFSKVELYANSKLPSSLPPLSLYTATWPLLSLAAQHSLTVYQPSSPLSPDNATYHLPATRTTKAMLIKSLPMDHLNLVILAIRGTSSFMDWAVNFDTDLASPESFLDDSGNLCHKGFLTTARRMVEPVAARLRALLQERPHRRRSSLLITGHSAGGAVASLLYTHMLSSSASASTPLRALTARFKRIHCVTFGTPPISLLPLQKPPRLPNSLFLAFANEGDPVVRAEKPYVKSLLQLLANPPPTPSSPPLGSTTATPPPPRCTPRRSAHAPPAAPSRRPTWPVPPATLCNAGRLVVLRSGAPHAAASDRKTISERLREGCVAVTCGDEELRGVIWGDPVAHLMKLYAGRVEMLAVQAAMGR